MHRSIIVALALAAGVAAFSYSHQATGQSEGWITLLDGKSLDNWDKSGTANWRIEDGAVMSDMGEGLLVSKNTYKDFQLRVEFFYSEDANTGVYIRCTDDKAISSKTAYEVNLWDTRPQKDFGTGAIVPIAKVDPMPKAAGKWGVYEITAKGNSFTVILNGQKTVDNVADPKSMFMEGKIALQQGNGYKMDNGQVNEKGVVKFRKVEIRPL